MSTAYIKLLEQVPMAFRLDDPHPVHSSSSESASDHVHIVLPHQGADSEDDQDTDQYSETFSDDAEETEHYSEESEPEDNCCSKSCPQGGGQ